MKDVLLGLDPDPAIPDSPVRQFDAILAPLAELYSMGLQASPERIESTAAWVRITILGLVPGRQQRPPVRIVPGPTRPDGSGHHVFVPLDANILALPEGADRRQRAFDWLRNAMDITAGSFGWPPGPLRYAERYCEDHGLVCELSGRTVQSPDRKMRASLHLSFSASGGEYRLQVHTMDGFLVAERLTESPFATPTEWRWVRNSIKWVDRRTVTAMDILGADLYRDPDRVVRLEVPSAESEIEYP